ncbi:MAG TPA: hypothetical protein VG651_08835 [Stellaceae bacterium]|nr:hypothetical protein [Stellaceae bacterium]
MRQKAERQTQFDADKAAFDADMKKFDAQLAELEIAKRVWQRLSGQTSPTLNGHDRKAEPEPPEADEDEAGEAEPEPSYRTHKEMVLDAVRAIGARGVMRNQIEQWIKNTYNVAVPPPSISTYLKRLRDDGLVRNPGDGLSWHPAGGPAR